MAWHRARGASRPGHFMNETDTGAGNGSNRWIVETVFHPFTPSHRIPPPGDVVETAGAETFDEAVGLAKLKNRPGVGGLYAGRVRMGRVEGAE